MLTLHLVGPRALLLRAKTDLDRDGKISNVEAAVLGRQLQKEAMGGLEVRCGKALVTYKNVRYKASLRARRKLSMAFLLSYTLPKRCTEMLSFSSANNQQRKGLENLSFSMNSVPPLRLAGGPRVSFDLIPGSRQIIVFKTER